MVLLGALGDAVAVAAADWLGLLLVLVVVLSQSCCATWAIDQCMDCSCDEFSRGNTRAGMMGMIGIRDDQGLPDPAFTPAPPSCV